VNIPILDTHQHLVYPDRWPYSWTAEILQLAGKAFRYDDYVKAIEGSGIVGALFMESSPDDPHWQDETRFVGDLSHQPGSLLRGLIANCRPEDKDGFVPYLESILSDRLRGLRRILHVMPDETSQPAHFAENIRLLAQYNLTFDLCVFARQLPIALRLAKACPEVQFILDHCGVPDIAAGEFNPWQGSISDLATLPNVACKISGILAYCEPNKATVNAVRPYVEHCIEVFGWDRVVWGSDWPVVNMTSTLKDWVAVTRELIGAESADNQRRLLYRNAERIYGVRLEPAE
jgi:predicted TIM-barrel fold metal-dependent hydrolase